MTPFATIEKVASYGPFSINSGSYGVIPQADGSYIAGRSEASDTFPFPTSSQWFRSTNEGATWSTRGTYNGLIGQQGAFPANIASNILCAHADEPADGSVEIFRSTNGAQSFSTVFSASIAPSPNGRSVQIWGMNSYDKTHAAVWGELDGDKRNTPQIYAISSNAGLTWTPQASFDVGDQFDIGTGMGFAGGGTWYMAYIKFGGTNRQSWLARSDNYGSTWTQFLRTRNSAGLLFVALSSFSLFDAENFVIGGSDSLSPASSSPGLWYSHDGGASLTHVSSGDVADFPGGSFTTNTQEVKRLTTDAAICAFDQQNGTPGCPYRITLDRGETWNIVPELLSGSWPTYTIPFGKICVTRKGGILSTTWESSDYESATFNIYRTDYFC